MFVGIVKVNNICNQEWFGRMIVCILLLFSVAGHGAEITPFDITNYNPLAQIYGLPLSSQTALLNAGQSEFKLLWDKTSVYAFADSANQHVVFDGESTHTTFIYNQSPRSGLQWGIVIPYVSHEAGSLDNFIINWHNFFHLPQGGRKEAPRNQLRFYYQRDGITLLNLTDNNAGIGDVRLTAGWQLPHKPLTLNGSLKLPTGESKLLHGSGATDLALWLAGELPQNYGDFSGSVYGSAGAVLLGKGDVLPGQQKRMLVLASVGAGIVVSPRVRFKIQLDGHSPVYQHMIGHTDSIAVQCTMGGAVRLSSKAKLDIGVSEDFNVDASPDVNFHFGLQSRL